PMPAGTRCQLIPEKTFKLPSGKSLTGAGNYQFEVTGPAVMEIWPATYEAIDEAQSFVLQLNGPATAESLAEHAYCRAEDVGERIPVHVFDAAHTEELRKALKLSAQPYYVALACKRRM